VVVEGAVAYIAQVEAKLLRARWYPLMGGGGIIKNLGSPLGEFLIKKHAFRCWEVSFFVCFFNNQYQFFNPFQ
jgi:hypothetical protein